MRKSNPNATADTRKIMSTSGPGQQQHGVMPDQTVEGWLGQVGMGQYLSLFVENQVRPEDLRLLNDEFLKDIGIQSVQHRKKILAAPKPLIKDRPKSSPRTKTKSSFNFQIRFMFRLSWRISRTSRCNGKIFCISTRF